MNATFARLMWDGAKCQFRKDAHWSEQRNSRNKIFISDNLSAATDSSITYNPCRNYLFANGILCLESSRFMKCFQLLVTIKVNHKVYLLLPLTKKKVY